MGPVSVHLVGGPQNAGGCPTTGSCRNSEKASANTLPTAQHHTVRQTRVRKKVNECPLRGLEGLREKVYRKLERAGERPRRKRRPVAPRIQAPGRFPQLSSFTQGVRVGDGINMPQVPAVYPRKRRWKLREQEDPKAYQCYEQWWWGGGEGRADNRNYASAAELAQAVEDQLVASVKSGQTIRLTEEEARAQYGNRLVVAALGAKVKSGSRDAGDLKIRLLFDGTHGVSVTRTSVRDQDRSPAAPDVKRVLQQLATQPGRKFGFKVDVKDAHRLVPVSPQDWHLLACRGTCSGDVFVNTTGTFWSGQRRLLVESGCHCRSERSKLYPGSRSSCLASLSC